jgi:hypothetical protein
MTGRPIQPATIGVDLRELHGAGLAAVDVEDQDELAGRGSPLPVERDPLLTRSTCMAPTTSATPTRLGWRTPASRPGSSTNSWATRSRAAPVSTEAAPWAPTTDTTPEMAARVIDAIQQRLTIVLRVAEDHPNGSALRVF